MISESGAMPPLAVPVKTPWVRSPASQMSVVEATWNKLIFRMIDKGASASDISIVTSAYVAGVYACAAAVLNERAHSRELAEAAWRIERG